jgi:hypothetical protein
MGQTHSARHKVIDGLPYREVGKEYWGFGSFSGTASGGTDENPNARGELDLHISRGTRQCELTDLTTGRTYIGVGSTSAQARLAAQSQLPRK